MRVYETDKSVDFIYQYGDMAQEILDFVKNQGMKAVIPRGNFQVEFKKNKIHIMAGTHFLHHDGNMPMLNLSILRIGGKIENHYIKNLEELIVVLGMFEREEGWK